MWINAKIMKKKKILKKIEKFEKFAKWQKEMKIFPKDGTVKFQIQLAGVGGSQHPPEHTLWKETIIIKNIFVKHGFKHGFVW